VCWTAPPPEEHLNAGAKNTGSGKPPIFVVGSARSGNTLLYHTLLSAGGFAVYRAEPAVFDLLALKFGNLKLLENRRKLMSVWLQTYTCAASGLNQDHIKNKILNECESCGDFLRILMSEVARSQRVDRWAVWGPDNLLYMPWIKEELPDARFIHMIRDGRDVAVSMNTEGWIRPFPWDKERSLLVAALHWQWKVRHGRQLGRRVLPDYLEVRFEDLVTRNRETLLKISKFIGHDLDYDRIRKTAIGTLSNPNSSFRKDAGADYGPIGRWKQLLSSDDITRIESLIGSLLEELDYPLAASGSAPPHFRWWAMGLLYPWFFDTKQWLKLHTPLRRFVRTGRLRLGQKVLSA
jgi:hypothetical protein